MLNFALKYRRLGLSVIPLAPGSKVPLIPSWKPFQERLASEEEIVAWFKKWPDANIGIVTGRISQVAIADLDGPEGIQEAKNLGLKSIVRSITGNGEHLWFKNDPSLTNGVKVKPGIDIRAEGGYVVAPPSRHANSNRYRWIGALNAANLPVFPTNLFAIPATSASSMETSHNEISSECEHDNRGIEKRACSNASQPTIYKPRLDIAKLLEEMKDGNIDDTLFTICSRLRSDGYSANDARILLQPHAHRVNATVGHLDQKIENVWNRYEPRKSIQQMDGSMRGTSNNPQSPMEGIVIHSPANSDSWNQYQTRREMDSENGPNPRQLFKTGYSKLDQMFKGGLKSSRLFTIAARTGVGKTNFILSIARTLCESGFRVLLFSTEMPYSEIWDRYIATLDRKDEFRNHAFHICDSFAPKLERVEEAINEIKPDMFMFDHINHVSEEQQELGQFMQGLNYLRRKYDVAGIVTAQLNRQADWVDIKTGEKVTPRMSMIKGSGTIEQASSRVLLLSETRVGPEGSEIIGNLDKNDNGPKGLVHFMLKINPYKMVEL